MKTTAIKLIAISLAIFLTTINALSYPVQTGRGESEVLLKPVCVSSQEDI